MATAIRILIHQTGRSEALLSLLGSRENIKLISSISQPDLNGLCFFDGVSILCMDGAKPNLDLSDAQAIGVQQWWEEVAIVSGPQIIHTRKSILLGAANKDGGAHVDPELAPDYKELQQGIFNFSKYSTDEKYIADHQFFAIRVFANELLNSPELIGLASRVVKFSS